MRVALFATCLGDTVFPEVPRATVRVLERLGHEVVFPVDQTCCGQLHLNSGFGGTFSVKNADVSTAMLADKCAAIVDTSAEVCAAVDASCLMHIGGGLSRGRSGARAMHLVEILAHDDVS